MKTLLITGGCGFIGSNFVRHILADSAFDGTLINLDLLTYAGNPENLKDYDRDSRYKFVQGSIGDGDLIKDLLIGNQVDGIVNFAAESHVDRSIDSPRAFVETNVQGTLELLHQARLFWKDLGDSNVFRFLHVSTDEVYGTLNAEDPSFTEDTPFAPNSPYAASKASSDHFVRSYFHTYGFPVLTTNCSNNYGPFQFPEKLIPLMILNALNNKALPIYGDGLQRRDWLYVEDHCRAINLVLKKGQVGETYNVGGDCEKANIEIVDTICSLLDELRPREDGKSYSDQKTFVEDRPGHDRRYSVNFSKINRELGWSPSETLRTGLRRTVEWYLKNDSWIKDIQENRYQQQRLGVG
ncbi:MAG: dTDP-glucose 4,6-dehydratase [Verrucomicrobiota bacterium]